MEGSVRTRPGRGARVYEAIKAVESAAHTVVQPNNAKATLGTMLREIRNARHRFIAAIPTSVGGDPIAPVEAVMRALWDGQTSRYGARTATVPETLEAARAGVPPRRRPGAGVRLRSRGPHPLNRRGLLRVANGQEHQEAPCRCPPRPRAPRAPAQRGGHTDPVPAAPSRPSMSNGHDLWKSGGEPPAPDLRFW